MNPTLRLVLLALLGAVIGLVAQGDGGMLSFVGLVVGVLVALQIRNAERIRDLEARLGDATAPAPRRTAPDRPAVAPEPVLSPTRAPDPEAVPAGEAASTPAPSSRRATSRRTPWYESLPPWAERAWAFATGGNPITRVGIVVFFVAIGLGIRYAAEQGFFPIELRLGFAAVAGAALLAVGWRLRKTADAFGLTLQGGGVAVLYLTIYAAYALYALIPSLLAIVLMAVVAAGCAALAVLQSAPTLALLGVAGGFAAPVLAGTEAGNHVLLLAYYALLNLGVLGIAWTKGWRSVAFVGFVSTFLTGGLWGGLAYRPELYASVQPFVVLNFAVYLVLAVRFALRTAQAQTPERALVVDGALVFGLPAATFVLQAGLIEGVVPYGRAWSAAALAVVYLGVWAWLLQRAGVRLLADALLAIGLTFATLALPLAFQRIVFGAMWVLEGAGLVWVGARQSKAWMRWAGLALQVVAAAVLFTEGVLDPDRAFSTETLTGWIVALGLGLSAYVLRTPRLGQAVPDDARPEAAPTTRRPFGALGRTDLAGLERAASRGALLFALFWWVTTASVHVFDLVPGRYEVAGLLGAAAASGALFLGLGRALAWRGLAAAAFGIVVAGWVIWIPSLWNGSSPTDDFRGLGWVALFATWFAALQIDPARSHPFRSATFVGGAWLAVAVLADTVGWSVGPLDGAWTFAVVGAVLAVGLALALRLPASWASPIERRRTALGLGVAATVWSVVAVFESGGVRPVPYVPALNPIDLVSLAAWAALVASVRVLPRTEAGRKVGWALVSVLGFAGLTAIVLRAVHHLGGVRWDEDALFASSTVQAALAVVWTLLAFALAVLAVRRQSRPLWFFGAAVLALVVAKLFLVDLSQAEALVRIAAFLIVGTLMLIIGYRAPLPPRRGESEAVPEA